MRGSFLLTMVVRKDLVWCCTSPLCHFSVSSKSKFHKTVSFTKRKDSPEQVKFCPSADGKNTSQPIGKRPNDWHRCQNMRGGYNRQQDVKLELQMNKVTRKICCKLIVCMEFIFVYQVRLIHEVYPDDTFQASRQVLTIADIEIRDRLAESHINKLLYQYCCEARPRQAHANMVLVKALHIRPDLRLPALECCLKVKEVISILSLSNILVEEKKFYNVSSAFHHRCPFYLYGCI